MPDDKKNLIGLRRGFEILDLLSRNPSGLSFGKLQGFLDDLPSPTLSRLLRVMNDSNWISKDSAGHYFAGSDFISAAKRLSGGVSISETVSPFVERLAIISEESAAFAEFLEDGFVFRAKHEMPSSYHYIPLNRKNISPVNGFNLVSYVYQDGNYVIESEIAEKIKREKFYTSIEPGSVIRFLSPVFFGQAGSFAGVLGISKINWNINDEEKKFYRKLVEKSASQITRSLSNLTV